MKSDKELYRQLRALPAEKLWREEAPAFDHASPRERMQRVALIRALGVAFAAHGTAAERGEVRAWLRGLLRDPQEKVRRYAMAALPKIGAGESEERELLALLRPGADAREKKFLGRALEKIGGRATLAAAPLSSGLHPQTEQKVKAGLARAENPGAVRLDRELRDFAGVRIHLRCRKGLEGILREEIGDHIARHGKFRLMNFRSRCAALEPVAPFSLGDIYQLRCFATAGFGLGVARGARAEDTTEALAALIASPLSRRLLETFTDGPLRYRLEFVDKGHQRGAVREIAGRAYALCPEILNDPRRAPWSMDLHPTGHGTAVELRPRLVPDPRWFYRTDDVWAASHPPLAACMARLAGPARDEIVWDPFCGSGTELIERALRGGVRRLIGTDRDLAALKIARANIAAAKLQGVETHFECADFRDYARTLGPESVTLVLTNPPMGRRVRVPDLRQIVADLFTAAAQVLRPGGRLVFANPLRLEPDAATLRLEHRQAVDLGGFDCRLELYRKTGTNT